MLLVASFFASSSVGSRTSQVAKLLQMYFPGMPAVFKVSLNVSFLRFASLLVLMSVTTSGGGSPACANSGIGRISLFKKYFAYLLTVVFVVCWFLFFIFVFVLIRRLGLPVNFERVGCSIFRLRGGFRVLKNVSLWWSRLLHSCFKATRRIRVQMLFRNVWVIKSNFQMINKDNVRQ